MVTNLHELGGRQDVQNLGLDVQYVTLGTGNCDCNSRRRLSPPLPSSSRLSTSALPPSVAALDPPSSSRAASVRRVYVHGCELVGNSSAIKWKRPCGEGGRHQKHLRGSRRGRGRGRGRAAMQRRRAGTLGSNVRVTERQQMIDMWGRKWPGVETEELLRSQCHGADTRCAAKPESHMQT